MDIQQLQTPALILDLDVFDRNCVKMQGFLEGTGMRLRPHYKSTKCTAIAHMQMEKGAKGITCAKLSEAQDLIETGIEDIVIANQITDAKKIADVAALAKCCRLTVAVDNSQNIIDLEKAAELEDSTIYCLVEYEIGMGRCGTTTPQEFYALAEQIAHCKHLVFEGVQAYAGHLSHESNYEKRRVASDAVERRLKELKEYVEGKGLKIKEISGSSTGTVQFRKADSMYTEIQAGSYVFMDMAYNELDLTFENSLFVLTTVISKSQGATIVDAGRKSVSVDQAMPEFKEFPGEKLKVSEEHSCSLSKGLDTRIGDKLMLIPGHCCTAMNMHDWVYFVRSGKIVDKVPVTSRGKSI